VKHCLSLHVVSW